MNYWIIFRFSKYKNRSHKKVIPILIPGIQPIYELLFLHIDLHDHCYQYKTQVEQSSPMNDERAFHLQFDDFLNELFSSFQAWNNIRDLNCWNRILFFNPYPWIFGTITERVFWKKIQNHRWWRHSWDLENKIYMCRYNVSWAFLWW